MSPSSSQERMTVQEAAECLGISVDGVRQRIRRGNLESEKDPNGRVYVWLDIGEDKRTQESFEAVLEAKTETIETLKAQVEAQRQEIEDWKRVAENWQEESRRKDHLLAAALERIPAIEPPAEESPDERESSVTASEGEAKGETPPEPETADSQPWWRRIFR